MAYIGNTAASRFVSNRAASVFSGDGSAVVFTLEQSVAQDEDILVSVDGVIQEPSVAYAVSSGTTLTFTAAPSSNSGNNIFVYYLASQVGTVGHPSTQGLTATTGAFSSNATVAGTIAVTGTSTLTGVTALGNTGSTVKSEGGAVTTNIAQGLVKSWLNFNGTGTPAARDSFNHTGVTDVTQGNYTVTMATAMANVNYSFNGGTADSTASAGNRFIMFGLNTDSGTLDPNFTTTAFSVNVVYGNSGADEYDVVFNAVQIAGDLA